jgi:alpha-tubulin suppressor-like RCC1 family protein
MRRWLSERTAAWPGKVLAPPAGLRDVREVALNGEMAIALHNDGTLTVWAAQNCDGETDLPTGLHDVTAVAAGFMSGYALRADGTIVGWGERNQPRQPHRHRLSN